MSTTDATRTRERVERGIWKRDGYFEIGYQGSDGRWRFERLKHLGKDKPSKREARRVLAAKHAERNNGGDVAPSKLTMRELWERYIASVRLTQSAYTVELYGQRWRNHVDPAIGSKRVQAVRKQDVLALMTAMSEKQKSEWTRRAVYALVSALFRHARSEGIIKSSPLDLIEKQHKPKPRNRDKARVLSAEEVDSLLAAGEAPYSTLWATMAYAGLRTSEALGLDWSNVNLETGEIKVTHQLDRPKTKRDVPGKKEVKTESGRRTVVLAPKLVRILKAHQEATKATEGYVFTDAIGNPLRYYVSRERLGRAAKASGLNRDGIPAVTHHHLRHSYGSGLVSEGVNIYAVSVQMGHADPAMTLRVYTQTYNNAHNKEVLRGALAGAFGD